LYALLRDNVGAVWFRPLPLPHALPHALPQCAAVRRIIASRATAWLRQCVRRAKRVPCCMMQLPHARTHARTPPPAATVQVDGVDDSQRDQQIGHVEQIQPAVPRLAIDWHKMQHATCNVQHATHSLQRTTYAAHCTAHTERHGMAWLSRAG
jgi:hypothetical protein